MKQHLGFWVNAAIAATFIVVAVFGAVSYRNTTQLVEISARVSLTYRVLQGLENLMSILTDAETGQRGFVITGDVSYLAPHEQAMKELPIAIGRINELSVFSDNLAERKTELLQLVDFKINTVNKTIELRRTAGFADAERLMVSGTGRAQMTAIRKLVDEIEKREHELLEHRRREVDSNANGTHRAIIAGHTLLFALLGIAGFALREERRLRDQAELSIQAGQQQIREQATLLQKVRDAVIACDMQGTIVYWNHAAELLYGWTAAEAIGMHIDRLAWSNQDQQGALIQKQLQSTGAWAGELEHKNKNGQRIDVEHRRTLIANDDGRPQKQLMINIDITERKKLEAQALRRQRLESIGTLAGGIAHDLNNVLTPILMGSKLLVSNRPGIDAAGLLSTIRASAERGADMVRQLLAFTGGVEGEYRLVDLRPVLEELRSIVRHTFPKSIIQEMYIDGRLWPVIGDPTALSQVLLNLCLNARDAMADGGRLEITASNQRFDDGDAPPEINGRSGPFLVISITDNGIGIPPETLERIFDPFFTTKEFGKGTGLGLSISAGIVNRHRGAIAVKSRVGEGTTFTVYLPAEQEAMSELSDQSPGVIQAGNGELILLVDDEVQILEIVSATLISYGYRVLVAERGETALEHFQQHRSEVRAIVIDMMMPGMDGVELTTKLLAIDPSVAIIATSGLKISSRASESLQAGARTFLPKPYSDVALLAALQNIINSKETPGEKPVSH